MAGDELGELEHANGLLAVQHELELVVGVDLGADLFVLKVILLDVFPEFFGELSAGKRFRTYDGREDIIRLNRFEKRCVGFASGFFCHNRLLV